MVFDPFHTNLDFSNSEAEVRAYAHAAGLQPAERRIAELLQAELPGMDMLDVGMGGGRTTEYFVSRVRRYIASDYAAGMIEACRRRFPGLEFRVDDAAELDHLPDASFDFVLFSFNGLDYMSAERRAKALFGFRRILRPGGALVFSSHNSQFLPHFAQAYWTEKPERIDRKIGQFVRFKYANRALNLKSLPETATVFEGDYNFKAPTFYVRPAHQVAVLERLGFTGIRCFANTRGEEVPFAELGQCSDPWIYYLCRAPKPAAARS